MKIEPIMSTPSRHGTSSNLPRGSKNQTIKTISTVQRNGHSHSQTLTTCCPSLRGLSLKQGDVSGPSSSVSFSSGSPRCSSSVFASPSTSRATVPSVVVAGPAGGPGPRPGALPAAPAANGVTVARMASSLSLIAKSHTLLE